MLNWAIERVSITDSPTRSAMRVNEITAKDRIYSMNKFYRVTKDFLSKYNFKPVYKINDEWLHSVYRFQNYLIKVGDLCEKIDFFDFHHYARVIFCCYDKNGNYMYEEMFDADLNTTNSGKCRFLEFSFDKYFDLFELLETTDCYD